MASFVRFGNHIVNVDTIESIYDVQTEGKGSLIYTASGRVITVALTADEVLEKIARGPLAEQESAWAASSDHRYTYP